MKFTYIKLTKNQNRESINLLNDEKKNKKDRIMNYEGKRYINGKHALGKSEKNNKKILNVDSEEKFLNKSYKNVDNDYKKEQKKENVKKLLSKNQVALYAISLMLIASGYFNYSNNLKMASIGDAQLVSANLSVDENEIIESSIKPNNEDEVTESSTKSIIENKNNMNTENEVIENNTKSNSEDEAIENSIKTNSEEKSTESSTKPNGENETKEEVQTSTSTEYFTQTKIERDKMYSQMIETYQKILENDNISTEQKNTASEEIKNINNKRNGIATSETLIKAKGIEEIVIIVNNEVVDAIVKSNENLSTEQVAQVSNIVSRELNTNIENIHITTHK